MLKFQFLKPKGFSLSTFLIAFLMASISYAQEEIKSPDDIYLECEKKAIEASPDYGDEYDEIIDKCLEESGYVYSDETFEGTGDYLE